MCGVFCVSRQSELSVKLNRQLERCLRNSKCIDTESLCVVSGEKVIYTNTHKTDRKKLYLLMMMMVMVPACGFLGVADQGGCSHTE